MQKAANVERYFRDEWKGCCTLWSLAFAPSQLSDRTNNIAESHFKVCMLLHKHPSVRSH